MISDKPFVSSRSWLSGSELKNSLKIELNSFVSKLRIWSFASYIRNSLNSNNSFFKILWVSWTKKFFLDDQVLFFVLFLVSLWEIQLLFFVFFQDFPTRFIFFFSFPIPSFRRNGKRFRDIAQEDSREKWIDVGATFHLLMNFILETLFFFLVPADHPNSHGRGLLWCSAMALWSNCLDAPGGLFDRSVLVFHKMVWDGTKCMKCFFNLWVKLVRYFGCFIGSRKWCIEEKIGSREIRL